MAGTFNMARATYLLSTHTELPLCHGVWLCVNPLSDVCPMCTLLRFFVRSFMSPSFLLCLLLSPSFPALPSSTPLFPARPLSLQNTVEHGFSCTTSKKICVDSGGEWADGLTAGHGQAIAKDRGAFSTATHALVVKWNILHQVFSHTYNH